MDSVDNKKMELIKRIDAILESREWGWADLARAMGLSEQRVNNWRTRGIPAAQIRHIETALGLRRYALDEDLTAKDEAAGVISEFAAVYRQSTEQGRQMLRNAIKVAREVYVERRAKDIAVVKDRRAG